MRRGSSSLLIVVGLFLLLAAGAAGVLLFYAPAGDILAGSAQQMPPTTEPNVPVVKAEIDIKEGTVITSTEGLLKMGEVPMSQFSKDVNLSSVEEARNMIATTGIKAGDSVRKDALRKAGMAQKIPAPKEGEEPVKAFPVQVNSLSGVADLVQAGDFVDVLASFNIDSVTFTPGAPKEGEDASLNHIIERTSNEGATKVLLQDIQVLDVIKPAPPVEAEGEEKAAEPTPAPAPNNNTQNNEAAEQEAAGKSTTAATTLNTGNWIIVIAVTNQEAEALRFALDRGIGITTILRRDGDHATERTVGATMRILADNYGMPMPSYPQVAQQPSGVEIPAVPQLPKVNESSFTPKITTKP